VNDIDRAAWVDNDEGLYDLWKKSGLSQREWIRRNRDLIDQVAGNVKSGERRQHYLKYGG
jgi:hypothetical protein